MKKFVLAPFLAALAIFVWGFLYWGAPPYLPYKALSSVEDDSATALAVGKLFHTSGTYLIPSPLGGEAKMQELGTRGPLVEVNIAPGMTAADQAKCMALGFVHMFVMCLLLVIVLCTVKKSFECWTCPTKFCAMLGLLAATVHLGEAIWWHHSLGWTLAQSIYDFTVYALAGLVLGKFVMPKAATPAA